MFMKYVCQSTRSGIARIMHEYGRMSAP
jgi:hypothetical protein